MKQTKSLLLIRSMERLWKNDRGVDSITGGVYFFYPDDKLKTYNFFGNKQAFSFEEDYDENGRTIKTIGKLLVEEKIREVNVDSALFKFRLFSLHKLFKHFVASINNIQKIELEIKGDTLYSNMSVASFGLNTKGFDHIEIYLLVEYQDKCTSEAKELTDTISLVKNPRLTLLPKQRQLLRMISK